MVDSAGGSNLNPQVGPRDELGATLPSLGGLATTIHNLVNEGLSVDEAAEKVAAFIDPQLVPALQTLAKVLQAVQKFMPGASAAEHGGE